MHDVTNKILSTKLLGLISTVVEVTGRKLVGGGFFVPRSHGVF